MPRQPQSGVVLAKIDGYKAGTLACTTRAKKGLDADEQRKIQELHDDQSKTYSIDEARQIARSSSASANPFAWDVIPVNNFNSPDSDLQSILTNFGRPTTSVIKAYDDVAARVGFDLKSGSTLSASTSADVVKIFDASKPLHIGVNSFLGTAWQDNLDNYSGKKKGIALYGVMRSRMTDAFNEEDITGTATLNDILYMASGRPPEIHHLLYKALYPGNATVPWNLVLAERSAKESVDGPGQHELFHKVSSGNSSDKFKVLRQPVVTLYEDWVKANKLA